MRSNISWALFLLLTFLIARNIEAGQQVTTIAEVDAGSGGIEVDADGNVYTSDFGPMLGNSKETGTRVWKVLPDGTTEVFAEGFLGASGNALDSRGNFFQANIRGNYITKIATDGTMTKFATDGLINPVGVVIDDRDTLWVANCGGASITPPTSITATS